MTEQEQQSVAALHVGWDILFNQAQVIALLPLEDWLAAFNRADSIAPVTDPTLYRRYINSGKGKIIREVIESALVLKRTLLKVQPDVVKILEQEGTLPL